MMDIEGVPNAIYVDLLLSPEECEKYITMAEAVGFEELGPQHIQEIKECTRCVLKPGSDLAKEAAEDLWEKLVKRAGILERNGKKAVSVNQYVRILKMKNSEGLFSHQDGAHSVTKRTNPDEPEKWGQKSFLSLVIYLKGDGGTHFDRANSTVPNETGRAILFPHEVVHHSIPNPSKEPRYILRSDVIFEA
eukprot:TRINITY_DN1646_c0_g1_i1.p1 TRINITY_DN1646_c0_g1~~TRINITY_DN1646_c0_g1_i1.p1  ORF type:complete len:191 (+),score=23.69 TRINITY_DN1646_c0_g1_i1:41-613(+)